MPIIPEDFRYTYSPQEYNRSKITNITPLGPGENYFHRPGEPRENSNIAALTAQLRALNLGSSRKNRRSRRSRKSRKSRR